MRIWRKIEELFSRAGSALIEPPVYAAAISAYSGAVKFAALKSEKARKLTEGHHNLWKKLKAGIESGGRYIWVHASSLGEFEQGRPHIERLQREHPEYLILLTFFSPSGFEVRKNYAGADLVAYLPFDLPWNARRFINLVRPEKVFFIKYEFWRNYLRRLHARKIPTYLISGIFRPKQFFFRPGGGGYRRWLHYFTHLYVQDERSRILLESIGVTNVTVAGDTRFDRVTDIMRAKKRITEVAEFVRGSEFTLCIGSSWPQDEAIYFPWIHANPQVKVIIAPHEFDDKRIEAIKKEFSGEVVTLSEIQADPEAMEGKRILVIDCFGLLSSVYAYCDAAYIGGAFGSGLHNINEAAVYGIPVVFGPKHRKFIEAGEIIEAGGGFSISSESEASDILSRLCSDPAFRKDAGEKAGKYIMSKIGATDIIYSDIFPDSGQA